MLWLGVTMAKISVQLGALCPKLTEQLKDYAPADKLEFLDRIADSITLLSLHGIITESQVTPARKRLMKRIEKLINT